MSPHNIIKCQDGDKVARIVISIKSSSFVLVIPFSFSFQMVKQNQDQQAKDTQKALQTMSSMSSAQIVSASAMHNKATAAGLASLGLGTPVPYTGAVSFDISTLLIG